LTAKNGIRVNGDVLISDVIRLVHAMKLSASPFKIKSVSSTKQMKRDLQNTKLADILSVSVQLIENRLTEFFRLTD